MRADQYNQFGQFLGTLLKRYVLSPDDQASPIGGLDFGGVRQQSPTGGQATPPPAPQGPRPVAGGVGMSNVPQRDVPEYDEISYNKETAVAMAKRYLALGYSPQFAAGWIANGMAESHLRPDAFNRNEGAYGIFQWRNDRLDNLRSFADRAGKNIDDVNLAVDFSHHELQNVYKTWYKDIMAADPQTAEDYARLLDAHYERSAGFHRDRRAVFAARVYDDLFGPNGMLAQPQADNRQAMADTGVMSDAFDPNFVNAGVEQRPTYEGPFASADEEGAFIYGADTTPPGQPDRSRSTAVPGTPSDNDGPFLPPSPMAAPPSPGSTAGAGTGDGGASPGGYTVPPGDTEDKRFAGINGLENKQSPGGGQVAAGPSPWAVRARQALPQVGTQRDGLGGLSDIFMRREGEGDQEFRNRRKSLFIAAAEGFHSLRTGEKANYLGAAQLGLNERQREFDRQFGVSEAERNQYNQDRQENRLQRAQELAENQFSFTKRKYFDEKADEIRKAEAIKKMADDAGLTAIAAIAETGDYKTAAEMFRDHYKESLKDNDFYLSQQAMEAAASYARRRGAGEMADILMSDADAESKREAYEQIMRLDPGDVEGFDQERYDMMVQQIKELRLDPAQETAAIEAARGVASGNEKILDNYLDIITTDPSWLEGNKEVVKKQREMFNDVLAKDNGLDNITRTILQNAGNPKADFGPATSALLVPLGKIARDIGYGGIIEKWLGNGASEDTATAHAIITAVRNGALPFLSKDIQGQLSNLEGDRILAMLGTPGMERTGLLALSHLMRAGIKAQMASHTARMEYLKEKGGEASPNFDQTEFVEVGREASAAVMSSVFPEVGGERERILRAKEEVTEAGGLVNLPIEKRTQLVYVNTGEGWSLKPLHAEQYEEYWRDIVRPTPDTIFDSLPDWNKVPATQE